MTILVTIETDSGASVKTTPSIAKAIESLHAAPNGQCIGINGYVPSSKDYDETPVYNLQALGGIKINNLYKRQLGILNDMTADDVAIYAKDDNPAKANEKSLGDYDADEFAALFEARRATQIESLEKSLKNWEENASYTDLDRRRQAAQRNFDTIGGVKVHLLSEKQTMPNGEIRTVPVADGDGDFSITAIHMQCIELNRTYVKVGKRKVKKSGAPVRMGNLITKVMTERARGAILKNYSLKVNNFDSVNLNKTAILQEDIDKLGELI